MKPDPLDPLSRVLHEWRDVPAADAGLAARMQRDLAVRTRGRRAGPAAGMQLRYALAGVTLGLLLGVAAVEWHESRTEAKQMPQHYLAWIDPLPASRETGP